MIARLFVVGVLVAALRLQAASPGDWSWIGGPKSGGAGVPVTASDVWAGIGAPSMLYTGTGRGVGGSDRQLFFDSASDGSVVVRVEDGNGNLIALKAYGNGDRARAAVQMGAIGGLNLDQVFPGLSGVGDVVAGVIAYIQSLWAPVRVVIYSAVLFFLGLVVVKWTDPEKGPAGVNEEGRRGSRWRREDVERELGL